MNIRKKMLMIALACLLCFQPTMKADDSAYLYKALLGFIVLYNIRVIGKGLGEIFVKIGHLLGGTPQTVEKLVQVPNEPEEMPNEPEETPSKPDSAALSNAKSLFNKNFEKFKAEENVEYTYNVYNKLPALGSTSDLSSVYTLQDKQTLVNFLEGCEKKVKLPSSEKDLLDNSYYAMSYPYVFGAKIREKMDMTKREYEHMYKPTVKGLSLKEDDFSALVTYMNQQFTDYRRYKNKTIINLCSAHTACEQGTAKQVKKIALDCTASEIVSMFHLAVQAQHGVNEMRSEEMQTSTGAVLACFGQTAQST